MVVLVMRAPSTQEDEGRHQFIKRCVSDKEADDLIKELNHEDWYHRGSYYKLKPQCDF